MMDDGVIEQVAPVEPLPLSWPIRVVLVAVSVGAAAIHLAMVPSHAGEWYAEGIAFALAGWLQIALAVAVLARPSRLVLRTAVVANAAFIAAWAWTRTAGPPFGPESGVAHDVGFVDLSVVCLEAITIGLAVLALARPAVGRRFGYALRVPTASAALGALALATVAIASPSASGHAAHDEGAAHAHGSVEDATTVDQETGHGHGAEPVAGDDLGLAVLQNGEMAHDYGPDQPLDEETRAALVHQLALTRLVAERFPTLGHARAAGSQPAGAFGPGMGIHMSTPSSGMPEVPPSSTGPRIPGTLTDAEILRPSNLLYAGSDDDSPLAGFMYYSTSPTEPEGFAGPNDHWHTHGNLCLDMSDPSGRIGVLNTADDTREACEDVDGFYFERTMWMVHVWTVPGYESNRGVFSDINPAIACPDGTYHVVPEAQTDRYQLNHCRSNPA